VLGGGGGVCDGVGGGQHGRGVEIVDSGGGRGGVRGGGVVGMRGGGWWGVVGSGEMVN